MSVGVYFERWRGIAFGISYVGGSISTMSFPWISRSLMAYYGWRGALMLTSGMMAQVCIGAMLLTSPPKRFKAETSAHKKESNAKISDFVKETKLLVKNSSYILHCIAAALHMFCGGVVFTHVVAYSESEGVSTSFSNAIVTAIGGGVLGKYIVILSYFQPKFLYYPLLLIFCFLKLISVLAR